MSKKTLLQENTIRRFMKLASISPLTENFVDKLNEEEAELEEKKEELEKEKEDLEEGDKEELEEEKEELSEEAQEEGLEEGYGMMPGKNDEMDEDPLDDAEPELEAPVDMDMDAPEEPEGGMGLSPEAAEEVAEKLATGFASVVEDALGVEGLMSVEKEGEMDMEEPPMDDMEMPMDEPPMEDPLEDEEALQEDEDITEEEMIDIMTKKIVERLLKQKKEKKAKEEYVDTLAEQITKRIFSSSKKDK